MRIIQLNKGKINSTVFDNKYNFQNSVSHEVSHRYDKNTHGSTIGEVNAILHQTNDPTWGMVSSDFAQSQAKYAASSFNKAVNQGLLKASAKQGYLKKLNEAFLGYASFDLTKKGFLSVSMNISEISVYGNDLRKDK